MCLKNPRNPNQNFKILAIFTIYICNKLGNSILSLKKMKPMHNYCLALSEKNRFVALVGLVPFLRHPGLEIMEPVPRDSNDNVVSAMLTNFNKRNQ